MKKYNIIKLNNDSQYACLILLCNANSPYDYLEQIADELVKIKVGGEILIDQILHSGNNQKRFIAFELNDGRLVNGEYREIKKDSVYRKTACEYLKTSKLVDSSILTSIQKRMSNKGIVI